MISGNQFQKHVLMTPKPFSYSQKHMKHQQYQSVLGRVSQPHLKSELNEKLEEERKFPISLNIRRLLMKQSQLPESLPHSQVSHSVDRLRKVVLPSLNSPPPQRFTPSSHTPLQGLQGSQGEQLGEMQLPTLQKIRLQRLQHSVVEEDIMKQPRKSLVFGTKTKAGCTINKVTKTNQDMAIVNPKSLEQCGYNFFAVCDGHGLQGHHVSAFLKNNLPKNIAKLLKDGELNSEGLTQALIKSFVLTNRQIWQSEIDTNLSGSTCVSILMKKNKIVTANVGDSRAVMYRMQQNQWSAIPLTIDHKPSDEREAKRIIEKGGRVECQKDMLGNPLGPERVWLSYIDAPGLAMTRSFGDKVGAQAGVIAEPEILEHQITPDDRFIVVASDGVWEYLTNEEVMEVVIPYYHKDNVDLACEKVVIESTNAWRRESLVRDDITCVIIFLK